MLLPSFPEKGSGGGHTTSQKARETRGSSESETQVEGSDCDDSVPIHFSLSLFREDDQI